VAVCAVHYFILTWSGCYVIIFLRLRPLAAVALASPTEELRNVLGTWRNGHLEQATREKTAPKAAAALTVVVHDLRRGPCAGALFIGVMVTSLYWPPWRLGRPIKSLSLAGCSGRPFKERGHIIIILRRGRFSPLALWSVISHDSWK
jgi:hypothetical protein